MNASILVFALALLAPAPLVSQASRLAKAVGSADGAGLATGIAFMGGAAAAGDLPIETFPENADLRSRYWDGFFAAPRDTALSRPASVIRNESGLFRISSLKAGNFFYLIAAAWTKSPDKNSPDASLHAQGTWILKRSMKDGKPLQAKVFLRSDPCCFIRIYPAGDRSRMDLVIYGGVINWEVPIPLPFDRVCRLSMADIASWTEDTVDWSLLSPHPGLYNGLRSLSGAIRSRLPGLRYAEDGALDADGNAVFIATGAPQVGPQANEPGLNCSGFAKWVVDGLYRPLTGTWLDPSAMAERHIDLRGSTFSSPWEENLDPFFGLDWTRNLGRAFADAWSPSRKHGLTENDVGISPFALIENPISASGTGLPNGSTAYETYPAFQSNLGYEVSGLKSLLYILAIKDPGTLYLASFSRLDGSAFPGLRRSYHVAILAPYFEEDGAFRVDVFESAAETNLEALMARTRGDYVHLVRIPAGSPFEAPPFPGSP
jgi:hypothetical protein